MTIGIASSQLSGNDSGGSSFFIDSFIGPGLTEFASAIPSSSQGGSNASGFPLNLSVYRFQLFAEAKFNNWAWAARSQFVGGSNVAIGIYDNNGNLLWSTGSFNVPNSSDLTDFNTPVAAMKLPAGSYYLAIAGDLNTNGWGFNIEALTGDSGSSANNIMNQNVPYVAGRATNLATEVGTTVTLPATLGAITPLPVAANVVAPAIYFQNL